MKKQDFIEALRSEMGTPWKHQGRLSGVALDCAGLVVIAARKCGMEVQDRLDYERRPDTAVLMGCIEDTGLQLVPINSLQEGDLLVMKYERNPQHLAVVTQIEQGRPPKIIHGSASYRKTVEHYLTEDWRAILVHAWRFPFSE